jgi:hypothetical protein
MSDFIVQSTNEITLNSKNTTINKTHRNDSKYDIHLNDIESKVNIQRQDLRQYLFTSKMTRKTSVLHKKDNNNYG